MPNQETARSHSVAALFTLLLVYLANGAVASMGMSLLFVVVSVFCAAGAAALARYVNPLLAAIPPVFGTVFAILLHFTADAAILSLVAPIVAFILAGGVRRGEGRIPMVSSANLALVLLFFMWGIWELLYSAYTLGRTDVFNYLRELIDGVRDALVAYEEESYRFIAALLEQSGATLTVPSTGEMTEMVSFFMSLLPGFLLLLPAAFALAASYLLELFAMAANDTRIFSRKNAVSRLGAVSAGLYLAALLLLLFFRDDTSVIVLTAINLLIFLLPALAYIKLLELPRFLAFLRRSASGGFDFAVWLVLSILCFFLYFQYVFPILATWQAISILKSAIQGSRKHGES